MNTYRVMIEAKICQTHLVDADNKAEAENLAFNEFQAFNDCGSPCYDKKVLEVELRTDDN